MTADQTVDAFVQAVVARDFTRARDLLHAEVDFRGMTPNRIWEAEGPADVEGALRLWLDDPEEHVERIDALDTAAIQDTVRTGWLVHATGADGPFVFEQQVYARAHDGRVDWLRVMCSGPRPVGH
jgi:hypothetical protein